MTPRLLSEGGDLAVLAEMHAACFAEAWSVPSMRDLLATPGAFIFSLDAGFILVRSAGDEAEILTVAVRPDRRRRGAGAALVRAAAEHAASLGAGRMFLEVALGNVDARGLYGGLGFAEVGRRKAYYASGQDKTEDALVLCSNLPLSPLGKRPGAG